MNGKPLSILQAEETGWRAPRVKHQKFWPCLAGCGRGVFAANEDRIVGYCCGTCKKDARRWNARKVKP